MSRSAYARVIIQIVSVLVHLYTAFNAAITVIFTTRILSDSKKTLWVYVTSFIQNRAHACHPTHTSTKWFWFTGTKGRLRLSFSATVPVKSGLGYFSVGVRVLNFGILLY